MAWIICITISWIFVVAAFFFFFTLSIMMFHLDKERHRSLEVGIRHRHPAIFYVLLLILFFLLLLTLFARFPDSIILPLTSPKSRDAVLCVLSLGFLICKMGMIRALDSTRSGREPLLRLTCKVSSEIVTGRDFPNPNHGCVPLFWLWSHLCSTFSELLFPLQ